MMFTSPIDALQIIFSSIDGKPLTKGKLKLFEIGTANPKGSFLNSNLTTPAGSVLSLDISGRPEFQVFLDYGNYTIEAWRFIGTDPYSVNPSDWAKDHEWDQSGLDAVVAASGTIDAVNSISALRALTPAANDIRQVLGYYARGDMFTRTYQWNESDTNSDNLGIYIKNPSISTGSWILITEGDVIDCRIFGILPSLTTDYTTRIATMVAAVEASNNNPFSIYFPHGVYHVSNYTQIINTNVIIDRGVYFANNTVGSYILTLAGTYRIDKIEAFSLSGAIGDSYLRFSNNSIDSEIDIRWYGAVLNGVADDGIPFLQMLDHITYSNYRIVITGLMRLITLWSNRIVYNPVVFRNTGRFYMDQTTYTVSFINTELINENKSISNRLSNPIFYHYGSGIFTNLNKFIFSGTDIHSNWFLLNNSATGTTAGLDQPLSQLSVSVGQNFIFDADHNNFTAGVDTFSAGKYNFQLTRGTISFVGSGVVNLNNIQAPDNFCIESDNIIIYNTEIRAAWYTSIARTNLQNSNGLSYAIKSALLGSGNLNLCGRSFATSLGNELSISYVDKLDIHNGNISYTGTGSFLYLSSGTIGNVCSRDMMFSSSTNCTYLQITGANCGTVKFSKFNGIQSGSTSHLVGVGAGGNITRSISILDSDIYVGNIFNIVGYCARTRVYGSDIESITGTDFTGSDVALTGNNFWGLGSISVASREVMLITGNSIKNQSLNIYSISASIQGNVSGNTFTSGSESSIVGLVGIQANTVFTGLTIESNAFTGAVDVTTDMIVCSGSFRVGDGTIIGIRHNIRISGNSHAEKMVVPQTSGNGFGLIVSVVEGSNDGKIYLNSGSNGDCAFIIPGCAQPFDYIDMPQQMGGISAVSTRALNDVYGWYQPVTFVESAEIPGTPTTEDRLSRSSWCIYNPM